MLPFTYVGDGENVFFFLPNIIGYGRVVRLHSPPDPVSCIFLPCSHAAVRCRLRRLTPPAPVQLLLVAACYYMLEQPLLAGPCYFLSGFLDHFDGSAARRLGQCSQFGATLDMVTDRVATTLLVRTTPFPRCLSPRARPTARAGRWLAWGTCFRATSSRSRCWLRSTSAATGCT